MHVEKRSKISTNASIVHRSTQKFYDKYGETFELGSGQFSFLITINENEGITMKALAKSGAYDKALVTKAVSKLVDLGLVRSVINEEDKRERFLYTTDKTKEIMKDLYLIRRDWFASLVKGLSDDEVEEYLRIEQIITKNAMEFEEMQEKDIEFFGMQKVSLVDYPGLVATTLFTGGCNMRCPFCHNADLVFLPDDLVSIKRTEVDAYLNKRKGIVEAVCISGGEPLMHPELKQYVRDLKQRGLKVKLDTNGSYPDHLQEYLEEGLLDYVAMDIKNGTTKYASTIGFQSIDLSEIKRSIELLKNGSVEYEFRTTVVSEFHEEEDILEIGELVRGAKRVYLQKFVDSGRLIVQGLHPVSDERMEAYANLLSDFVDSVEIRG